MSKSKKSEMKVLYHISRYGNLSPKITKNNNSGKEEAVIYLTPNWKDVAYYHGIEGNVYAWRISQRVIKKVGRIKRFDNGSEVIFPSKVWEEGKSNGEIVFLGRVADEKETEYNQTYWMMRSSLTPDEMKRPTLSIFFGDSRGRFFKKKNKKDLTEKWETELAVW